MFAGGFLLADRQFNPAVDDYVGLLGLPAGIIENVTDGVNAHLVAIDADGKLLGSEEDIVDANRRNRIDDIYLLNRRLTPQDTDEFGRLARADLAPALDQRTAWRSPEPAFGDRDRGGRSRRLRAWHSALQPVSFVPHARA